MPRLLILGLFAELCGAADLQQDFGGLASHFCPWASNWL